jgi:hypothetical protein
MMDGEIQESGQAPFGRRQCCVHSKLYKAFFMDETNSMNDARVKLHDSPWICVDVQHVLFRDDGVKLQSQASTGQEK